MLPEYGRACKRSNSALDRCHTEAGTTEVASLDDSLTNLSWLYNMSFSDAGVPNINPCKSSAIVDDPDTTTFVTSEETAVEPRVEQPYFSVVERVSMPHVTHDFKKKSVKPPFSYAQLLFMAMSAQGVGKQKLLLAEIYQFIMDNFIYYKTADPTWQNSVRHTLSLNRCFIRYPRENNRPGKGGYWTLNPQFVDVLENGVIRRKKSASPIMESVKKGANDSFSHSARFQKQYGTHVDYEEAYLYGFSPYLNTRLPWDRNSPSPPLVLNKKLSCDSGNLSPPTVLDGDLFGDTESRLVSPPPELNRKLSWGIENLSPPEVKKCTTRGKGNRCSAAAHKRKVDNASQPLAIKRIAASNGTSPSAPTNRSGDEVSPPNDKISCDSFTPCLSGIIPDERFEDSFDWSGVLHNDVTLSESKVKVEAIVDGYISVPLQPLMPTHGDDVGGELIMSADDLTQLGAEATVGAGYAGGKAYLSDGDCDHGDVDAADLRVDGVGIVQPSWWPQCTSYSFA
ncbi:PREDICTED: forkhead box protein D3-like [Priapulus caudatus]|uniref:Forkhead box protein D3-like n=1 Tax=Priapulus caudatus TaxID=37621 RepID=A0ABM1FAZ4_PRICU|nr:PREDICTED: forkhead box protein D3-like [Priapulus caudatus]